MIIGIITILLVTAWVMHAIQIERNDRLPRDEKFEIIGKPNTEFKKGIQCMITGLYQGG